MNIQQKIMNKKIIICIIACIICFMIGLFIPKAVKLALTDNNDFYINTTNIIINDNTNENVVNEYLENIKTMPSFLLENCNTIIFTNENLNEKFNLGFSKNVLAVTVEDIIYINDSKYKSNVVIHELFHVYDYKNNWKSLNDNTFDIIYNNEKNNILVSPGNNQNKQELFATIGEEFYCNSESLLQNAPEAYEYMKNIMDNN